MTSKQTAVVEGAIEQRGSGQAKLSHNLNGQRLGPKGRGTRERILAATNELLAEPGDDNMISLSAVARKASLRMASLYNYFNDLTELLLAVLEPVMATAEESYVSLLRERWADDQLEERTMAFVTAYHAFWIKYSRILHLRNQMSDRQNERMMMHRVSAAGPVMRLLVEQMDGDLDDPAAPAHSMASALMTGMERVVTVATDMALQNMLHSRSLARAHILQAQARLMELGIRDYRKLANR